MAVFKSLKEFRDNATEQDYADLETFILSQDKKTKAFPCENYGFTYSSAATELRNKGYLGGRVDMPAPVQKENGPKKFAIDATERQDGCVNRTFSVPQSILERIDKLSSDNWQYSKKAVINKLLDVALKEYGY